MASFNPSDLTTRVIALLNAAKGTKLPANVKIGHYGGEFFDEETVKRLKGDVEQFPYIFVDLETIEQKETDQGFSYEKSATTDRFILLLYSVAASNHFDETAAWVSSYDLAWNGRRAVHGEEFVAITQVRSNGFFAARDIEREFHEPGISVHTVRVEIELTTNQQAE